MRRAFREPFNNLNLVIFQTVARLLDDEETFSPIVVIIVEEAITASRQSAYLHIDLGAAGDDLLDTQRLALEFGGLGAVNSAGTKR
jgi:hypothetical protein